MYLTVAPASGLKQRPSRLMTWPSVWQTGGAAHSTLAPAGAGQLAGGGGRQGGRMGTQRIGQNVRLPQLEADCAALLGRAEGGG